MIMLEAFRLLEIMWIAASRQRKRAPLPLAGVRPPSRATEHELRQIDCRGFASARAVATSLPDVIRISKSLN
jgi:hypothetical protein